MIRRDISEQWQTISDWYWQQYHRRDHQCLSIWEILYQDYGAQRSRPMSHPEWSLVDFPDERSYTMFLLKWSAR